MGEQWDRADRHPELVAELRALAIERDAAISMKLIQLVNSSMFAVAQRVDSVRDATSYLGMNLVRMLVLSAEVAETTRTPGEQ